MLILAGFLVGVVVGLTGVGGGALMTPLLLLFFGVAPVTAIGTDLWFAAITKMAAGKTHHTKGLIDWQVLHYLWMGSLPVSVIMILLMRGGYIALETSSLKDAVAIAILITAVSMLFQKQLHVIGKDFRLSDAQHFKYWQPTLTVIAGAILGGLVTLTSIGAGAVGVVMLTYLYPLRLTPARLVATDIVHAIPLAMFAGMGHLFIGNIDFGLLGWLLIGSIPGVLIGATLSSKLPQTPLRICIAVVLALVAIRLLA
ncbi:sulfite exporter TauE/SafE family protein [Polynucleobacter sp. CS-Odin-A6]|uniref:sulfite exporter TauE/SafE family protein n=1 Tax=Polynucleobacter sp. CS-Odin-A6 TaxID=2689106 RepID=UPI001C0D789C|nr:sulfite exporter TauE/SafE family protein [Polynucleobacter sp. CS-Odin-A6]MBU3621100.1 sulfite exporter TauE/SafE family protein [Polynucleobacter sp. CS-Odin-A6]